MSLKVKVTFNIQISGKSIQLKADLGQKPYVYKGNTIGLNLSLVEVIENLHNCFNKSSSADDSFVLPEAEMPDGLNGDVIVEDLYLSYSKEDGFSFIGIVVIGTEKVNFLCSYKKNNGEAKYVFGILGDIRGESISDSLADIEIKNLGLIYANKVGLFKLPEISELNNVTELTLGENREFNKGFNLSGRIIGDDVSLELSEQDGFVSKVVPRIDIGNSFDLNIDSLSASNDSDTNDNGIGEKKAAKLELGPISILGYHWLFSFENGAFKLGLAVDIGAELAVFKFTIEKIGLLVPISLAGDEPGNAGPFQVGLEPKAPTGIGLSIESKTVTGGGFLYFNPEEKKYAGVAELSIKDKISLKAIGILTTKLPGRDDGYSLLLLISAEFSPIQLGFGFTLNGVGGLVALNRTMNVQALRDGVKSNSIDSVMFPENPVANAPQIISDLEAIFPIQEGRYVFGLMGLIGWGTPTLISIEIGLMIEVPSPIRIAILGVVKAMFPTEDQALLKLQVNFAGIIDFEAKYITFDASLFDSRLLTFSLSGDMAFRMKWGDEPNFLVSIGGFHPAYTPPPLNLPNMRRLTINLLNGDNPRLTLSTYFALTSNSLQFGAAVEFYLKVTKNIKVIGLFGFDVLIQFSPFYLRADIYAMLAVMRKNKTFCSVSLYGMLEGPSPWHAKGTGEFKVLGIKLKASFDKTFGRRSNTTLPSIEVLPLLKAEVDKSDNWEGEFPSTSNLLVSLKKKEANDESQILSHPNGSLRFSQKKVPLNITMHKFGNQNPVDYSSFSVEMTNTNGMALTQVSTNEFFAPAEFYNLTDSQKLSRKSFEKISAGVKATDNSGFKSGAFMTREVQYEHVILDSRNRRKYIGLNTEKGKFFDTFVLNNVAANSVLSRGRINKGATKVVMQDEMYVIANLGDLSIANDELGVDLIFGTQAEAEVAMEELYIRDPLLIDKIDVVSSFEIN